MTCVSNEVGGGLVGNARWLGVRLDELLEEVGVDGRADQIVGRSVDGYTCGFPVDALDGRGRARRRRHERRAAAAAPRVPRSADRARALRLRVGDQVAHRDRAHPVRRVRPVLGAARLGRAGADQDREPHRHPQGSGQGRAGARPDRRCRVGADPWHRRGRGAHRRRPVAARRAGRRSSTTSSGASGSSSGTPSRAATPSTVRAIEQDGPIQTDERSEPLPNGSSGHHQIVVLVSG